MSGDLSKMDDLINRIKNMEWVLQSNLNKQNKVQDSLKQLSGFELNILDRLTRKQLEEYLVKVNRILMQYDIKTFDDYSKISELHLNEMLRIIQRLCFTLYSFAFSFK